MKKSIMSEYTYKTIISKSKTIKKNVEKEYKLGVTTKWSYYIAKAILKPKKDVKKITFKEAPKPTGTHISRQIPKKQYTEICKNIVNYVEKNKRLPNYVTYNGFKIRPRLYTYMLARVLVYYEKNNKFANYVNVNSKAFTKPVETKNEVYNYFCKVFGEKVMSVDEALKLIDAHGYAYYYDDLYSNKQAIDRMKAHKGVNCTDSTHVFYNIVEQLVELGKYKKVEALHVQCSSGGHIKLRITLKDGSKIIRDPACALSDNGKGYKCNWCTNTGVINPKWFMENLYR